MAFRRFWKQEHRECPILRQEFRGYCSQYKSWTIAFSGYSSAGDRMIIRKLYIENFGKLKNREIVLCPGINVLYGPEEHRTTVHGFIKNMLFGQVRRRGRVSEEDACNFYEPKDGADSYGGKLWLQDSDKTFCVSRSFLKGQENESLVCENDEEVLDMQHGGVQKLLGGISETVYEQKVCVSRLRSTSEQALAGELQNYMAAYEVGGDASIDMNRTMQALKMWRKGYQDQIQHRQGAQEQEYERISLTIEQLHKERKKLETRRTHVLEQTAFHGLRQALNYPDEIEEAEVGYDQRIAKYEETRTVYRVLEIAVAVVCLFALVFLELPWLLLVLAAGGLAESWLVAASNKISEMMSTYRKEKIKRIRKQTKLRSSLEQLNEAVEEKDKAIENLVLQLEELQELSAQKPPEKTDINGLNLAMSVIGRLSYFSDNRLDNRLGESTSRILSEITEGTCSRIGLDDNWKPVVEIYGESHSLEELDGQVLEMVYFAFRMALGAAASGEESLPVLLDEIFAGYEKASLASVFRWLAASGRQVIISTCSMREAKLMKEMGILYNFFELS